MGSWARLLPIVGVITLIALFWAAPHPQAAGSAHNGLIAFSSDRSGDWDIWTMNPDGTDQRNLTRTPGVDETQARWSPDGTRLVFTGAIRTPPTLNPPDVYVMDADGSDRQNLTSSADMTEQEADWSPDGAEIVFSYDLDDGATRARIRVMGADGSAARDLTDGTQRDAEPSWSPDGTQIAFTRFLTAPESLEIFVMNADGSDAQSVGEFSEWVSSPAWSHDGQRLVLTGRNHPSHIITMQADGSDVRTLTSAELPGFSADYPAWSPDGSRIAYLVAVYSDFEVFSISADGGDPTRLTSDAAQEGAPSWQAAANDLPAHERPALSVSPRSARVGDVVNIHGANCALAGQSTPVRFEGDPDFSAQRGETVAGTAIPNGDGAFDFPFTIPDSFGPAPWDILSSGSYTITTEPGGCVAQLRLLPSPRLRVSPQNVLPGDLITVFGADCVPGPITWTGTGDPGGGTKGVYRVAPAGEATFSHLETVPRALDPIDGQGGGAVAPGSYRVSTTDPSCATEITVVPATFPRTGGPP